MSIFKRTIAKILKYFLEETTEVSNVLEIVRPGKQGPIYDKYLITSCMGVRLHGLCVSGKGEGERLISRSEALDKQQYDQIMSRLCESSFVWEDTREKVNPSDLG